MPDRPLRFCDACLQLDDHPRHVLADPNGGNGATKEQLDALKTPDGVSTADLAFAVAQLIDPTVTVRHMDCCAAAGCTICAETETANGGRRGQELIDHLDATRVVDAEV